MNGAEHLLGAAALARHGARPALLCGAQAVSYDALAHQVRIAASAYAGLGIRPGERVLLLLQDTPAFAAAWLGAVWHGALPIGLNNKLPEADLRFIAGDSEAQLLVTEPALARDLGVRTVDASALAQGNATLALRGAGADEAAFWVYSSGTTGRPKGIVHAHRAILACGQAQRDVFGLNADDRVLATSKLFFAYALENGLLGPLSLGASAVLHPGWASTEEICAQAARHRPSALFSVPSFYRQLLALEADRLSAFRGVRRFAAAGERVPGRIIAAWRAATGGEILSVYGTSETFCASIVTPPGSSDGTHTGRPLQGVGARLSEGEGGLGVLWLRHPALAIGYANRAEDTQAQFRDGWFCTRDLFTCDAHGNYAHQGRADELMKVAGQWVRPAEIEEAALAEAAVAEAACVSVRDADGFERLALFVAARGDDAAALAAAGAACASRLARHQRPKWIRAVAALPRTATGKVQRFRLREMLARELGHSD